MYRRIATILCIGALSVPAWANPWEKYYSSVPAGTSIPIPSDEPPAAYHLDMDPQTAILFMYRKGNMLIGYSGMNGPLPKLKDAVQFGQKIHVKYIVIGTEQAASRQINVPITTPTTRTSETTGNVTAFGSGGFAQGNYSGTTTTYGSQTTYIPIIKSRWNTVAMYFSPMVKKGLGAMWREPTSEEIAKLDTRHALIVAAVRNGSPADTANILEGDALLTLNGQAASGETLAQAAQSGEPIAVHLIRNGQPRDVTVTIPPEWRSN